MAFKSIVGVVSTYLIVASFNVYAIPTSADWLSAGDGLITSDANTGFEWLDLSYTTNRSYNDISSKFGVAQEFEGWRYATGAEVESLWDSFGASGPYIGQSVANNGVFDLFSTLLGDLSCEVEGCNTGEGFSHGIIDAELDFNRHYYATASDDINFSLTQDAFITFNNSWFDSDSSPYIGSYLVRDSVLTVPEPSIAIIMASGLLMLVVRSKVRT